MLFALIWQFRVILDNTACNIDRTPLAVCFSVDIARGIIEDDRRFGWYRLAHLFFHTTFMGRVRGINDIQTERENTN